MSRNGIIHHNQYLYAVGQTATETALVNSAFYPASASFVDVRGYERVHVLIPMGTIAGGDTPIFTLMEVDSASGTPVAIDTTNLRFTGLATDDGQMVAMTLETAHLTEGSNWVTVQVTGISGTSYANVIYMLAGLDLPVTQSTTLMPSDNQLYLTG